MQVLASVLYWILSAYFWCFIIRFVLDLILAVNRGFRPRGVGLMLAELVMTLTDPPLKLVRKVIKPIRIGSFGIDLAWTVTLLLLSFLLQLVARIAV